MQAGKETLTEYTQRIHDEKKISSELIHIMENRSILNMNTINKTMRAWISICSKITFEIYSQMLCIEEVGKEYRLFYNDLKPDNIVMDVNNKPRLIDLGSAYPIGLPSPSEMKGKDVSTFLNPKYDRGYTGTYGIENGGIVSASMLMGSRRYDNVRKRLIGILFHYMVTGHKIDKLYWENFFKKENKNNWYKLVEPIKNVLDNSIRILKENQNILYIRIF